jgi:hypothetical protein
VLTVPQVPAGTCIGKERDEYYDAKDDDDESLQAAINTIL